MKPMILVVDDEPDVEVLFRQQFRRNVRADRFIMEFVLSAPAAFRLVNDAQSVSLILILSEIYMPGMTGLNCCPGPKRGRTCRSKRKALEGGAEALLTEPIDFAALRGEIDTRVEKTA